MPEICCSTFSRRSTSRAFGNLREMPAMAAAYQRYLKKLDKQETEIEKLQEQQKKLQADELKQRQEMAQKVKCAYNR